MIRQDIDSIVTELREFETALTELIDSFSHFKIEQEQLESGEGEIGILIPRHETRGLWDFSKDLRRLDYEIKTISQLISGRTESLEIRTISSSDFMVFLSSIPEVVNVVSQVITSLRVGYEKLHEFKQLLNKLRSLGGASKKTIENMEKDAEGIMSNEISNIISEIRPMYEMAVKNGLAEDGFEVTLESTVKGLSTRIDKGYGFSFRVGPPRVEDEESPTEEESKQIELANSVSENNNTLQSMKLIESGQQILPLEWQTEDPADE